MKEIPTKSAAVSVVIVGAMLTLGFAAPFGRTAGPANAHGDAAGADLSDARLDAADLRRANLKGATLSSVTGLTQAQLGTACVDDQTTLPADLSRPAPCPAVKKEAQP